MDPHDLFRLSHHWNKALSLLVLSYWIDEALGTGANPSWTFTVGKVLKPRVNMLEVTFFCSDLRVRTRASINAWILSLRIKYMLVGCWTIRWKWQQLGSLVRPTLLGHRPSGNLSLLPLWSRWKIITTCSSLKEYTFCNALISRVQRHCYNVYTQVGNTLIYICWASVQARIRVRK